MFLQSVIDSLWEVVSVGSPFIVLAYFTAKEFGGRFWAKTSPEKQKVALSVLKIFEASYITIGAIFLISTLFDVIPKNELHSAYSFWLLIGVMLFRQKWPAVSRKKENGQVDIPETNVSNA